MGSWGKTLKDGVWGLVWSFLQLLDNGKYDSSNTGHTLASQLIKSLSLGDCDKMISEASALGDQVANTLDYYGSNDDYKD